MPFVANIYNEEVSLNEEVSPFVFKIVSLFLRQDWYKVQHFSFLFRN